MVTPFAQGAVLRAAGKASTIDIERLAGPGSVLVLAPHPDDESLGCGAAIAAASRMGRRVVVAAITDGSHSHQKSKTHPPDRLAALRQQEMRLAVGILTGGAGALHFLGYEDQHAPSDDAAIDACARRLCALADAQSVTAIWSTWEGDPHCDHQGTAKIAARLAVLRPHIALWRYPVWGRFIHRTLRRDDCLFRFEASGYRHTKSDAVQAHRSQMTRLIADDPEGFVMDAKTRRHFVDSPELFIGTRPR